MDDKLKKLHIKFINNECNKIKKESIDKSKRFVKDAYERRLRRGKQD